MYVCVKSVDGRGGEGGRAAGDLTTYLWKDSPYRKLSYVIAKKILPYQGLHISICSIHSSISARENRRMFFFNCGYKDATHSHVNRQEQL